MRKPTQTLLPANVFAAILADRKESAAVDLGQFPQYDGKHEGPEWTLFRAKREIKTKLGVAAVRGEIVLGKIEARDLGGPTVEPIVCFYSVAKQVRHARLAVALRGGRGAPVRRRGWIRALRAAWRTSRALADEAKTLAAERRAYAVRAIFHAALRTTTLIGRV
jgi:hypothetical protein